MLSYKKSHNFSALLNTLRGKIQTPEAWTAVYMLICTARDKTCFTTTVYLFNSMLTLKIIPWTKQNIHLYQYSIGFHREGRHSAVSPSLEDKTNSLNAGLWPSYELHDNSDSAKLSGTRSSFLPVAAVQVAHFLIQLWMAPLLSFHPHSFLSRLPPPELLAILPEVKIKANKRLLLKIFYFLKRQNKNQVSSSKTFGWTLNPNRESQHLIFWFLFFFLNYFFFF